MKRMSKILFLLLIPVLLVGALPLTAMPVSAATNVKKESALVNAVNKGNDVTLKADIEMENMLTIPEGVSITLDLNGYSLDRALDYEAQEDGSVILVEEGAELYIKDNSGTNAGLITGGASYFGGGICNYGTLTIQGGTITGNCAYDETDGTGGGVYNEGELTLLGGVITENEANYGGGLYNAGDGTVTIQQSTYLKKVGASSTEITMNVEFTANYAEDGKSHGVFNGGTLNIEGAPNISGNEDNDIYLAYGKKLNITGEMDVDEPIGIQASGTNPVFTSGFKTYLGTDPSEYFKATDNKASLQLNTSGEAMLMTEEKSKVYVYKNDSLTKSEEYDSVASAWSAASGYAQNDSGKTRVEVVCGSDCTIENSTWTIGEGKNIVFDLNGHYLKRNPENKNSNTGRVFEVGSNAKLTIKDSNPDAKGYDGLKGGVIVNTCGGGIQLKGGATFEMTGGTIYNCNAMNDASYAISDDKRNGGGIYAEADSTITIDMKNCSIRSCTTGKYGHYGGAIYYAPKNDKESGGMTLENVDFRDNNADDCGGAICLSGAPGTVRINGCYFSGNNTNTYGGGGALAVYDPDKMKNTGTNRETEYKPTYDLTVNSCTFYNNSASYGGVYYSEFTTDEEANQQNVNANNYGNDYNNSNSYGYGGSGNNTQQTDDSKENDYPVVFKNCTMKNNSVSGADSSAQTGSVMEPDSDNPIVIIGGEITGNSGGRGAIIMDSTNTLSVSGKVIIKDNKNDNGSAAPGFYRVNYSTATLYSAGLETGSYIEIGCQSSTSGEKALAKNVSKHEKDYFHRVDGSLQFSKTGTETAQLATASIFGNGSWIAIAIMIAIALAGAAITVIIVRKKRKGGVENAAE